VKSVRILVSLLSKQSNKAIMGQLGFV